MSLPLRYALLVHMTAAFSGLSDVWQARHNHLTPAHRETCIPKVCQEVLDDWCGNDIANILCLTARERLERYAHTLPNFIEDRPTCHKINHTCHVGV